MGPQHLCCGKVLYDGQPIGEVSFNGAAAFVLRTDFCDGKGTGIDSGFNGAAAFVLRKAIPLFPGQVINVASMGPQHLCCGKNYQRLQPHSQPWLQWGRSICAAESGHGLPFVSVIQ